MKSTQWTLTIAILTTLVGCDPVHSLRLENQTDKDIEVIYTPTLDQQELEGHEPTKIKIEGQEFNSVTLKPTETIRIGRVSARYNPKPSDIHLDYLEIRLETDTLKLLGRDSIFSTIQKVENLDWRLLVKAE